MADPLLDLTSAGVAIWLDDLSRARLATGSLAGLVNDCHVVGVTSNPTIFKRRSSGVTTTTGRSMTSRSGASGSRKPSA